MAALVNRQIRPIYCYACGDREILMAIHLRTATLIIYPGVDISSDRLIGHNGDMEDSSPVCRSVVIYTSHLQAVCERF